MRYTSYVFERFPDHWQMIKKLSGTSADFQALCADYGDAVEAKRHWEASADATAAAKAAEFAELVREIEDDILKHLLRARKDDPATGASDGGGP